VTHPNTDERVPSLERTRAHQDDFLVQGGRLVRRLGSAFVQDGESPLKLSGRKGPVVTSPGGRCLCPKYARSSRYRLRL
jgi:hypothetical protein